MRVLFRQLAVAAFALMSPVVAMATCSSERVVSQLRDSVVKVESDDGAQVSGVVVAQDRVVTVWHGIQRAAQTTVRVQGQRLVAGLLNSDGDADLALLAVPTGGISPLTLLHRPLGEGENVWVYGWPADRFQTVGEGVFVGGWNGALRVSSLVQAGQSGGALIACEGGREMLAGLVTGFGATEIEGNLQRVPDMSLAVSAAELLAFFARSDAVSLSPESTSD